MRAKKIVYFFSMLLLFSAFICTAGASPTTTVSFRGAGVTIDLTFPEEAHPDDNIWHNATLTANIALTLRNLTLVIRAPVNSIWQEATSWALSNRVLQENASLTEEMNFQLPSNANGTLQCFIFVNTSQSTDYLSTTFYTTRVSELTFSEMQSLYNEMLANYTTLQANFDALTIKHDELVVDYDNSLANYATLLNQRNELSAKYNAQVATYESLLAKYDKLSDDYDALDAIYRSKLNELGALQSDYSELNSTRDSIQSSYNTLQAIYDDLNKTYIDLQTAFANLQEIYDGAVNSLNSDRIIMFIFTMVVAALVAFIIYIKRKKQEPYVVIRKETVAVNSEEKS